MLIEVSGLRVSFPDRSRRRLVGRSPQVEVLKGIDFQAAAGESIGIVGESGSGKSTLARTLLRLIRPTHGTIRFEGRDITHLDENALRPLRLRMQMVFQDSQSALNPRQTVERILAEPFRVGGRAAAAADIARRVRGVLDRVGLAPEFASRYAHQLSGGQRQRVGIGRAIALDPALIVADEIVSGLDVSVQAQILQLLNDLRRSTGLTLILISHDLSVVRATCDRVLVMRLGEVVESGSTADVFSRPQHPYTRRLLRAIPLPDVDPGWIAQVTADELLAG